MILFGNPLGLNREFLPFQYETTDHECPECGAKLTRGGRVHYACVC